MHSQFDATEAIGEHRANIYAFRCHHSTSDRRLSFQTNSLRAYAITADSPTGSGNRHSFHRRSARGRSSVGSHHGSSRSRMFGAYCLCALFRSRTNAKRQGLRLGRCLRYLASRIGCSIRCGFGPAPLGSLRGFRCSAWRADLACILTTKEIPNSPSDQEGVAWRWFRFSSPQ
jgi:hypothetical protein